MKYYTQICALLIVAIMVLISSLSDPLFWRHLNQKTTHVEYTSISSTIKHK